MVVMDATVLDAVAVGTQINDMAAGNAVTGERSGRGKKAVAAGAERGVNWWKKNEGTGSQ